MSTATGMDHYQRFTAGLTITPTLCTKMILSLKQRQHWPVKKFIDLPEFKESLIGNAGGAFFMLNGVKLHT